MASVKYLFLIFAFTFTLYSGGPPQYVMTQDDPPPPPPAPKPPPGNSPNQPGVKGIKGIMGNVGKMASSTFNPTTKLLSSGDWGIKNLRLNSAATFTSFNDSSGTAPSSGHFRDYSITLSGDISEKDLISLSFSSTRFETGNSQGILSRSLGVNVAWHHALTENYGAGTFLLWSEVDIEEINGNSHTLATGAFFTTFHEFEHFDLSSVTTIAYADFDTDHDVLFLSALTISKKVTDELGIYATVSMTDSLRNDPDADPTYGTWEVGGIYSFTEQLALSLGYQRTVFLKNYSDHSLLINLNWNF